MQSAKCKIIDKDLSGPDGPERTINGRLTKDTQQVHYLLVLWVFCVLSVLSLNIE